MGVTKAAVMPTGQAWQHRNEARRVKMKFPQPGFASYFPVPVHNYHCAQGTRDCAPLNLVWIHDPKSPPHPAKDQLCPSGKWKKTPGCSGTILTSAKRYLAPNSRGGVWEPLIYKTVYPPRWFLFFLVLEASFGISFQQHIPWQNWHVTLVKVFPL